jgi:pyruvate/2-oxoglutarate/acetoin dehydrogenase E1 component
MITYGQSISRALDEKLKSDKKVILLGEDIRDPYGGAFKITKGLSAKYAAQVINTPMSEHALTGVASGLAMRGVKPVLEIMFGDFMTLCGDQIVNHATKFSWMYKGQVKVPLVIRTTMGGRRGYGATHSQTLEKIYLGIPGLKIIAPSHFHNPGLQLIGAIDDNNPVLFIEHKLLYSRELGEFEDGYISDFAAKKNGNNFDTLLLSNTDFEDARVTILTYGGMLPWVIDAVNEMLEEEEIGSEVVVPSFINKPLIDEVLESLEKTGRLVIAEEGTLFGGWGAEMAAMVITQGFELLEAPVQRVAAKDLPIANTKAIEDKTLPQVEDIKKAIRKALE